MAVSKFTFSWEQEGCSTCGRPLQVCLTRRRTVLSAAYGKFVAVERQGYCPQHPDLPPARSQKLQRIVASGCNIAHDVIAHVGVARFLQCRQAEEIQQELSRRHGIDIPTRTLCELSQKFVAYFRVVHQQSIPQLRTAMRRRGGYILHVDGSCEEASRVLLVCLDSLSGQVLESRKIGSENHEEVRKVLQDLRSDWGVPLAVVHDLRQALISAVRTVFPGTPQFVCHYHFVADVGKDLLSSLLEVESTSTLGERAEPQAVKGAVHALGSWILAFSHSGDGYGFPFDLPYLTLYDRIVQVHQVLSKVLRDAPVKKRGPLGTLWRLADILERVVAGEDAAQFREIVAETKRDKRIFEQLRTALRICPKGGAKRRHEDGGPRPLSPKRHQAVLKDLRQRLHSKAKRGGPARKACDIVVKHLDKYSDLLCGHVLKKRSGRIVVPRTNNVEESLFRTVKRQCRRLHGRGKLCRDMEEMSEAAPLVLNLTNASYCETVYGGTAPQNIAERFCNVDPSLPMELLKSWRQEKLFVRLPRKFERLPNLPQQLARFLQVAFEQLQQ